MGAAAQTPAPGEAVRQARSWRERIARGCDWFVIGAVMLVAVWAPLAGGGEAPAAAAAMEQVCFGLIVIWALKATLLRPRLAPDSPALADLAAPIIAFAAYAALQLLPLSPAMIKLVSPSTYEVYIRTLTSSEPAAAHSYQPWQTLSIAPGLTRAALMKVLAWSCVLLVIARYPLEPRTDGRQEQTLCGNIGLAVLVSALMVGLAGAASLFAGHRASGGLMPLATLRAKGTFHNADHFADYLMLAFPVALAGALSPESFMRRRWREPFAVVAAAAAVVCLVGLMISLSRGAWIAGLLGTAAFVLVCTRRNPHDGHQRTRLLRYASLIGCLLLLLAVLVAGPPAAGRMGARLSATAHYDTSMLDRVAVWRDSLAMVRDFPALGVGLGCWPELFSHYDRAPWDPDYFWGQAHNDYLQLLAEAGAIGVVLAGWILLSQARRLIAMRKTVSPRGLALVAAAIAAAAGAAIHEMSDFSLQVPANAFLLAIILGLAHRQGQEGDVQWWQPARTKAASIWGGAGATAIAMLAIFLIVGASHHDRRSYPYNLDAKIDAAQSLDAPRAAARIAALIRAYPAHGELHLALAQVLAAQHLSGPAKRELDTAVWLEPANPEARDALAQALLKQGDRSGYLREITRSVQRSPRPSTHDYLRKSAIRTLAAAQLDAIERGYRLALWNPDAVYGLGYFYNRVARLRERGLLYQRAAQREADRDARWDYLVKAGQSYMGAGDAARADAVLHQAARLRPSAPRPYRMMAALCAARHDLTGAREVTAHGIAAGANPVAMNLALAQAAARAGDKRQLRQALDQAMDSRPVSFDDNLQIGVMYMDCGNYERAVAPLKAAIAADPGSADGYYYLALAQQNSYEFADAAGAFKQALRIAPNNLDIKNAFAAFKHMLAEGQGRHVAQQVSE